MTEKEKENIDTNKNTNVMYDGFDDDQQRNKKENSHRKATMLSNRKETKITEHVRRTAASREKSTKEKITNNRETRMRRE